MKVVKSIFSSYTGEDLADIEAQIREARAVYQQRVDEYNYSISQGHQSYAKRKRLPAVNQAKSFLDSLEKTYSEMLSVMGKTQAVEIVNTSVAEATMEEKTETPWKTIGLAVGALIVVLIIIKLI